MCLTLTTIWRPVGKISEIQTPSTHATWTTGYVLYHGEADTGQVNKEGVEGYCVGSVGQLLSMFVSYVMLAKEINRPMENSKLFSLIVKSNF